MAGVTLTNLTKRFGKVTAVDNLSLEIKDKEFLVLVGPSGCGKTTALRMVAGLEEATEGEIYIGERLVNDVSPKDRDIAMVFQNYALYPHMSVYDNMAFGLRLRRSDDRMLFWRKAAFTKKEIDARVQAAAAMLGLGDLLARKPKELSGGQRQRVALGRAIVREPKVFLMDEPLSNLDAKLRVQTRAELIKLHRRLGITTIYVTHDQMEAMTMGDRIAVMKDGLLQQIDTPLNLYNQPANLFVAGFIGSPAMNFMEATLEARDGGVAVKTEDFALLLPADKADAAKAYVGKAVTLGIRPEDIYDKALNMPLEASDDNTVRMNVDVTELMGATVYAYLTSGKNTLIAELEAATQAKIGGTIDAVFDMSRAHLFDKETEAALF